MQKFSFNIVLVLSLFINVIFTQSFKNNLEIIDPKLLDLSFNQDLIIHFFKQPKYTQTSISCFLKHTYNNQYYAEKFLALNFSHLITLLEYSNKSNLPKKYIYNVISLFNQKICETQFVNTYAFIDFFEKLPKLLKIYFNAKKERRENIQKIEEKIYELLTSNYENLKNNPEKTIRKASIDLYNLCFIDKINKNGDNDISIFELRKSIILFIGDIINRLIWSPLDQYYTWLSVKKIANILYELFKIKVIENLDDLDKLFWKLLSRYVHFLNLNGDKLNLDFYKEINKDLDLNNNILLNLKEREDLITTKAQYLQNNLIKAELKARLYLKNLQSIEKE